MKKSFITAIFLIVTVSCLAKSKPELLIFSSPNLHRTDSVLIFSPKKASASTPVLVLLHGRSGCFRDWSRHMDLQALSLETGFRIICPDGFKTGWYMDVPEGDGMMWRKFFWEELWPELVARYGMMPDRTFIDGLSMGGNGAMNIFLDRPELFRGAGSMSGVLDLNDSSNAGKDLSKAAGRQYTTGDLACRSAIERLGRLREVCNEGAADKLLLISSGASDRYAVTAGNFAEKCRTEGLRYVLMINPGRHKWPVWTWTIRYHLDWFSQHMKGAGVFSPGK